MCNYYDRHRDPRNLQAMFRFPELPNMEPRYVVRPTNTERVVIWQNGGRHLVSMRWGLVPFWTNDVKTGLTMYNAQSETILEKRSFSEPLRRGRRCLVPVDGFFEFTGERGGKQPHYFKPRDDRMMAFAGLWESWRGPLDAPLDEPLLSFTFATCAPNAVVVPIRSRMPVLLSTPEEWDAWLSPDAEPLALTDLLRPAPDVLLETFPVTRELLKIKEPGPEVLMPVVGV